MTTKIGHELGLSTLDKLQAILPASKQNSSFNNNELIRNNNDLGI